MNPIHHWKRLSLPQQMTISIGLFCLLRLLLSRSIPENGGLGWDGWGYAKWIRDFDWEVMTKGLDSYYIQRLLPPMLVRGALLLLGISLTDSHIVSAYLGMNCLALVGVAYIWGLIAERLKLSVPLQWLGCVALFLNFGVGCMAFFNPVLTDFLSLLVGTLQLYFALQGMSGALLTTSAVGGFIWPTALFAGVVLFLFHDPNRKPQKSPLPKFKFDLPVIGPAVLLLFFSYRYLRSWPPFEHSALNNFSFAMFVVQLLACSLCFFSKASIRDLWDRIKSKKVLIALVLVFAMSKLRYSLSNHQINALGYSAFLMQILKSAIRLPALTIVSHVVYFGPVLLLPLIWGRAFIKEAHREDFGLFFLFASLILLNTESRLSINFLPFIIAFAMKSLEGANWKKAHYAFFITLTLLFSKVWLPLASLWVDSPVAKEIQYEFPAQWYFMTFGPWMSLTSYAIQGAAVLGTLVCLYLISGRRQAQRRQSG